MMMPCSASAYWLESSIASFGVAVLLTGIIIPQILLIAFRKKLFDKQDSRKIHHGVVPRLGGIAFLPSILISLSLVAGLNLRYGGHTMMEALAPYITPLFFQLASVLLLFLVGMADDLIGVRYRAKFLVQILCGIFMSIAGLWVNDLYGLVWIHSVDPWFGAIVTTGLVILVVNSVNLIDGIDGLAAGLSSLALGVYALVLFMQDQYIYCIIACAAVGTLIPFIYYNVFGNARKQKKIFMGDTGSLTTGMVIVFLCLSVLQEAPSGKCFANVNPAILAFSPLVVPVFDVARVTMHRLKRHRNPFLPDRSHIHHKLLAVGFSSAQALLSILCLALFFLVVNFLLSPAVDSTVILLCDVVIWTLVNMWLTIRIHRREKRLGRTLYE